MYSFPSFSSPFYRRYPYYPSNTTRNPTFSNSYTSVTHESSHSKHAEQCKKAEEVKSSKTRKSSKDSESEGQEIFEIFGIKLYFDDILLVFLLFFLYTEGVEDQMLFIALILLLLS